MTEALDKDYWEQHWQQVDERTTLDPPPANPYLIRATQELEPGSALDAGCGEGAEAIWLAASGWDVTAIDISSEALTRARHRATDLVNGLDRLQWVQADVTEWDPDRRYDLVTTHYAHPAIPQLEFYERVARWVTPGGSLLIVAHRHVTDHSAHGPDDGHTSHHEPADGVSVTAASVVACLVTDEWKIIASEEPTRTLIDRSGRPVQLHDVVVHAARNSSHDSSLLGRTVDGSALKQR